MPMTLATVRMARDEVTRGTTRAVKTLSAVEPTMKIPAISPPRRRTVSIPTSCHVGRGPSPTRRSQHGSGLDGYIPLPDEPRQLLGPCCLVLGCVATSGRWPPATLDEPDPRDEQHHAGQ